jgi:hypothetical protein
MYWRSGHRDKRRFVIGRFIFIFGFLALLFMCALTIIGSLAFGPLQEAVPRTLALALILCGVPFGFLLLLILSGRWVFRRMARPWWR